MVFKTNVLLITICLFVLMIMSLEVDARDMPAGPSLPLLKSKEAQDTGGPLNDQIRPQWIGPVIQIGKNLGQTALSLCLDCDCCWPESYSP
ncbi:uncharacterized protein LOC132067693 [Lycium ferocissimum]|uniref:uncharacterized protein LOC132067693 n=1 Tax=Lycium ferocissimum TaxID=112874 RepID=UPI00281521AC|nr:uncharacterized protein LOC132067693 [Lycium ferocissimum]